MTRSPNLVPTPGLGAFRGGSLPNVSAPKKAEQIQKIIDKEQVLILRFFYKKKKIVAG